MATICMNGHIAAVPAVLVAEGVDKSSEQLVAMACELGEVVIREALSPVAHD